MLRLREAATIVLLCWLAIFDDLLPAAFAEHELERRVAIQRISIALQGLLGRFLLLLLKQSQLTRWKQLLEGPEEFVAPLLLLLDLLLPKFRLIVLLSDVHVKVHALVLEAPYNEIIELSALDERG